jgi:hypothetical protein
MSDTKDRKALATALHGCGLHSAAAPRLLPAPRKQVAALQRQGYLSSGSSIQLRTTRRRNNRFFEFGNHKEVDYE